MKRRRLTAALAAAMTALALFGGGYTDAQLTGSPSGSSSAGASLAHAMKVSPMKLAKQRHGLTRAESGRTVDRSALMLSGNWAGEVMKSRLPGHFQGISATWRVPAIRVTARNKYSSTWVGVDGATDAQLIQTGTEEDSINGRAVYHAWWEILPRAETLIRYSDGTLVPVAPGDAMWGYVVKTSTPHVWKIYLQDITQGWKFSVKRMYYGRGLSAEWIEEATQVAGRISPMPAFSPVTFKNLEYATHGKWYYTALTRKNREVLVQHQHLRAYPAGVRGVNPQRFSVYYYNR
jgi:Peptidase A4 family